MAHSTAASVAYSFAIEVSAVFGFPWSFRTPARRTSIRAASRFTTISAISSWTSWKRASGTPNCLRSVEYAKERKQFGVPIASFQLVQELIADMIVKRDAARLLVYRAGELKDRGERNTVETSIAKYYATEAAVECANSAIQVHGGSGYVDDYPVERYLRDARVTTLYEGTSQIHQLIIGRDATGINAMTPPAAAE